MCLFSYYNLQQFCDSLMCRKWRHLRINLSLQHRSAIIANLLNLSNPQIGHLSWTSKGLREDRKGEFSEKSLSTCVNNLRKHLITARNATGIAYLTLDKGNSVDIWFSSKYGSCSMFVWLVVYGRRQLIRLIRVNGSTKNVSETCWNDFSISCSNLISTNWKSLWQEEENQRWKKLFEINCQVPTR